MLRTLFKRYFSLFLIPLALFISCENLVNDDSINTLTEETSKNKEEKLIYLSGCIDSSAAKSSSQLQNIDNAPGNKTEDENQNVGRSAIPLITADTSSGGSSLYEYFVKAETSGDSAVYSLTSEGSVDSDLKYTIGLKSGYTWKITAGIRRKSDKLIVMSDWFENTLMDERPVIAKNMSLKASSSGNGSIELNLSVDSSLSSVAGISVKFKDSEVQESWDNAVAAGSSISKSLIKIDSIPAGIYNAEIDFITATTPSLVIYSVKQVINVFPGVTTNKWIDAETGSPVNNFYVTPAKVQSQIRQNYYVAEGKVVENDAFSSSDDENNDGSPYKPLATISKAIAKINSIADASIDYRIYVAGTIIENVVLSSDLKVQTLTITGISGKTAVIDGAAKGSVFTINTGAEISVKLYGLTVQNGLASKGAGINLENGKLEVTDCEIKNNTAEEKGGAVYIAGTGELTLGGNIKIPYGDEKKNDIYVCDRDTVGIKLGSSITSDTLPAAVITHETFTPGTQLISGSSISSDYTKFDLNSDEYKITDEGKIAFDVTKMIESMTSSGTVVLTGSLTNSQFSEIKTALANLNAKNHSVLVTLDISGTTVKSIPDNAFKSSTNLEGIVLPEGLTTIGDWAFMDCYSLKDVVLPSSLRTFSGHPFQNCSSLESIEIPEGITTLGREPFLGCKKLSDVKLPSTLVKLEDRAFKSCTSLTTITLPSSLSKIEGEIFYSCTNLSEIIFEGTTEQWESIPKGTNWNYNCPATVTCTKDITADNVVEAISGMTESGSVKVRGAISEDTIYNIKVALSGLSSGILVDLDLSATTGIDTIVTGCFANHTQLKSITLPDTVTSIAGNAFINCTNLVSVNLPAAITVINMGTFTGCSSLTSIELPDSITKIGVEAFDGCTALSSINFPSSVAEINTNAFGNCTSLSEINYTGTVEQWNAIDKEESEATYRWNKGCNSINVICTDGNITIPAT